MIVELADGQTIYEKIEKAMLAADGLLIAMGTLRQVADSPTLKGLEEQALKTTEELAVYLDFFGKELI